MNQKTIAMCTGAGLLALAAVVVSQGNLAAQKVQPISLMQRSKLSPLGDLALSGDPHTAFAAGPDQMFGAGRNFVSLIGEDGKTQKRIPTSVASPTIAPMGADQILIGDKVNGILIGMNTKTGQATPLLKLPEISDSSPSEVPNAKMIGDGKLSAVAFDGKNVLIAVEAGFSSMIFKVDPSTKQVVGRGFAGCPDPSAMAVHDGQVLVLSDEGSEISRFSSNLEKTYDRIELPAKGNLGIGVKGGEVRALAPNRSIRRLKPEAAALASSSLSLRLDRLRLVPDLVIGRPAPAPATPMRYAVLICGDLAENFSGECFWNDTVWMFKTLLANGYKREDIFVLYGDGADYISGSPYYQYKVGGVFKKVTNFAATKDNVRMIFDSLKNGNLIKGIPKMDGNDTLFLWTFDHGGRGTNPSTGNPDSTLGLRGGSMWATEFASKANAVAYQSRVVFMQQCYSGGFIPLMQNAKTFISTACMATEVARPADNRNKAGAVVVENEDFGGKNYSHGEFNYHITTALNRLKPTPPGGVVNADLFPVPDTWISGFEMMMRNLGQESRPETPKNGGSTAVGMAMKWKK